MVLTLFMQRNIKLLIEYEGTNYHGWQTQEDSKTIQAELEDAVLKLTGEKVRITGSGRTDAGVHSRGQVANFFLQKNIAEEKIYKGLNACLPEDIRIKLTEVVDMNFHARYSAKQRSYHYYIYQGYTALMRRFSWQVFQKFSAILLNDCAGALVGDHDFSSFSRVNVDSNHKRCIVFSSEWSIEPPVYVYKITANRFLHGMVRTIVGTMMDVAFGKSSVEAFEQIFRDRDRTKAGQAVPAKGLVLEEVIY
jgi:tRNA pseudouridine38-40 synthase